MRAGRLTHGSSLQVGQTVSGKFLSMLTGRWGRHLSHVRQVQLLMGIVVTLGFAVMGLHAFVTRSFPQTRSEELDRQLLEQHLQEAAPETAQRLLQGSGEGPSPGAKGQKSLPARGSAEKPKLSLQEAVVFLARSPHIQCLAVMALSQGLSTNLIEIAWKSHLHMLHPSPAAYAVGPLLPLR